MLTCMSECWFDFQLPANAPGTEIENDQLFEPLSPMWEIGWSPGTQLHPGPILAVPGIWIVNQQMEDPFINKSFFKKWDSVQNRKRNLLKIIFKNSVDLLKFYSRI